MKRKKQIIRVNGYNFMLQINYFIYLFIYLFFNILPKNIYKNYYNVFDPKDTTLFYVMRV